MISAAGDAAPTSWSRWPCQHRRRTPAFLALEARSKLLPFAARYSTVFDGIIGHITKAPVAIRRVHGQASSAPIPSRLGHAVPLASVSSRGCRETNVIARDPASCRRTIGACATRHPTAKRDTSTAQRSPLHSMLVRMPRGTTGDAFRAAMRTASAHVDPRVPLTDLALPTGKHSRLDPPPPGLARVRVRRQNVL